MSMRVAGTCGVAIAILGLGAAARAEGANESSAEYYNPVSRAIAYGGTPPSIWERPPKRSGWRALHMGAQHVEELRGLTAEALAARFKGREAEYVLSTAGGAGVRIKAPGDIRAAAGEILGALMIARRMEVSVSLEHYALSRGAAARLDGLAGALIDAETLKWLRADARKKGRDAALLGRLGAAGVARDSITADNVTPVPAAYLRHQASKAPEITYVSATRGGWFSANVSPAGPTRWHVSLRALLAWGTRAAAESADVSVAVGQSAVKHSASLRLPEWRSLALRGELTVPVGKPVLIALAGASDDAKPAIPGKPFEALVLRVSDSFHGARRGPVAFCFDGSRLNPALVLERMRELAKKDARAAGREPASPRAWVGSTMMLLGDASVRPLCLRALKDLLPSNEPQRLRVLMGGSVPEGEGLGEDAAALDGPQVAAAARAWWGGNGLVSVASVAVTSGRGSCQLRLEAGAVDKAAIGLGQVAAGEGIELKAGCTGAGRRRRLAVVGAMGVPRPGLVGVPTTSVNVDRMLEHGRGFLTPAGGRAPRGAVVAAQLGPIVEAESASGTRAEYRSVEE